MTNYADNCSEFTKMIYCRGFQSLTQFVLCSWMYRQLAMEYCDTEENFKNIDNDSQAISGVIRSIFFL